MEGIKLFEQGIVKTGEREFTRLVGGFGDDKPIIVTKQIADLMGYELKRVNETINNNIEKFEEGLDIIDLKKIVDDNDHLLNLGYSKVAVGRSNSKFYALSEAGFLLYLKFADGEKATQLYKEFIEDYFKTKAENKVMKSALTEELKKLKEDKALYIGKTIMETDEKLKIEYVTKTEELSERIAKIQSSIDNKEIKDCLAKQSHLSESKEHYCTQAEFGAKFNTKIGAKTVGKLLRTVGLAKKSLDKTTPYHYNTPQYSTNILDKDDNVVGFRWNYSECIKVIDKWLEDRNLYEKFYGITDIDELSEYIKNLFVRYVLQDENKDAA